MATRSQPATNRDVTLRGVGLRSGEQRQRYETFRHSSGTPHGRSAPVWTGPYWHRQRTGAGAWGCRPSARQRVHGWSRWRNAGGRFRVTPSFRFYRHPGWLHPQRSSVMSFASLQCSLQYLPNSPPGATVQEQPGCAHGAGSAIVASMLNETIGSQCEQPPRGPARGSRPDRRASIIRQRRHPAFRRCHW